MSLSQNLSSYIKKLGHPIKEIRERALQLLVGKLKLGWVLDDELIETRQLLEMLLAWFHVQQPTLQKEALILLLSTIKTKAGTYIAKQYGIPDLLTNLYSMRHKLDAEAIEVYDDIIETLQFFNTVQSEDNVGVPRLQLASAGSSETEFRYNDGLYNSDEHLQSSNDSLSRTEKGSDGIVEPKKYIKALLFPWAHLCASDSKTLILVEDAFQFLKSMKRCCRFICDVFLRDFPTEVFLNRPTIVQNLLALLNGSDSNCSGEAMHVLLCVARSLRLRLKQFTHSELIHVSRIIENMETVSEDLQLELEEIVGDSARRDPPRRQQDDALILLKQLPAPYYALDSLHTLLSVMSRSVYADSNGNTELLDMNELNKCTVLTEELIELLLDCVGDEFWQMEHNTKTHRDIAHKSCMCMRLLGDLLSKYRASFSEDIEHIQYRSTWLRLVMCAERLLSWSHSSSLPPSSLVNCLHAAQLDPALQLFYLQLDNRIANTIQNSRISKDEEYTRKYRELTKLFASMESCVKFIQDKNLCRSSKTVLSVIENALPVLDLHQSDAFLKDVVKILFSKLHTWELNDKDWNIIRNLTLTLMANDLEWVRESFYTKMAESVKKLFTESEGQLTDEKRLAVLCDVSFLTEICCHGLSDKSKQVESSCCEIMLLLLRGRLLLSEGCWWRLLAALLPVSSLLHVYADHGTQLGQAICKSLELDIAECMGVPRSEVIIGLVRLLFLRCPTVQLDAAHSLCQLLDEPRYLPPKETLRADVLVSALRRLQPDDFNIDRTSTSKSPQTTGLLQVMDVVKQDLVLDDDNMGLSDTSQQSVHSLEPSLRRATLQQLSVLVQKQELHNKFVENDGLRITVALLRMSLLVDDYLAFPECALSCVSILNSVCYTNRHTLVKIQDLPALLIRVILVFPANESVVLMAAQVLSVMAWAGFALQELDHDRKRVLALPSSVVERTTLPFAVQSYWVTSANTKHSSLEWLLSEEMCRAAIRVRWRSAWCGPSLRRVTSPLPCPSARPPGPLALAATARDLALLQAACPLHAATANLIALQNATSHRQVKRALADLESYCHLLSHSTVKLCDFAALPWMATMSRFLTAAPASPKDVVLLTSLLKFILVYIRCVPCSANIDTMEWIKISFLDNCNSMILLLSKEKLFPQQTTHESIEVTQLHIHIVKVLTHCIILLDKENKYDSLKLESLLKILLACLDKVNLKNFHMLGYLNELVKCIRYLTHSHHCELSEESCERCMRRVSRVLRASSGGCRGQACRLDAILALLSLLTRLRALHSPVQRWGDVWSGEVMHGVMLCGSAARAELRAAALHLLALLAQYPQLLPQIQQAIPNETLSKYAAAIFAERPEANVVRSAAATLLVSISSRTSPQVEVFENEILDQLNEYNFLEHCLEILVDFCKEMKLRHYIEPNIPVTMLERYAELEVRSQKCGDVQVTPVTSFFNERVPPTADLVATLAEVIHNVAVYSSCPIQEWNDKALFRMLFRCTCWGDRWCAESGRVRASACRALARAAAACRPVRAALASTHDCLHSLLCSLHPAALDSDTISSNAVYESVSQGLLLLAILLSETSASDSVWNELREGRAQPLFSLLFHCLNVDNIELQKSSMFCLNQLTKALNRKKHNATIHNISLTEFFDSIKALPLEEAEVDCSPEYMSEQLCKALIYMYKKLAGEGRKTDWSQDEFWVYLCSSLASLLSHSGRARLYAVHRGLPDVLLATLTNIRDQLSLHGKPAEVIRNANSSPTLCTLQWVLVVIDCMMIDCDEAKECFADNSIAISLIRLWPWCMMTEQLREAIVHLLYTFTNRCPKAWSAMCTCVGGRTLAAETCALAWREAALQARPHSAALVVRALHTLAHLAAHHHARPIILKSEVLSCVHKLRLAERGGSAGGVACGAWARLAATVARHADGAARVLALRPAPPAALALPALANAAHHQRTTFLQTPELLDLISGALLSSDVVQLVTAGRAVWALAANNHKAKLALRSAGVTSALHAALERLRRSRRDAAAERALQLLTYTDTLLQTT